jgi:3D (Asp-Asp-Asp) domain-containing protein
MNTITNRFLVLLCGIVALSSCTLHKIAKATPLEPGVKYEVRPAIDSEAKFPKKKAAPYYFMLDAPEHSTPESPLASLDASNLSVRTTAYCHSESDHIRYGRLAATGSVLKFGKVCSAAADWSRYPMGTRFKIASQPGVVYEVDDYGSALVGSGTIDLYRPTAGSMNAWGVREVDIEIIQWGSFEDSLRLMRNRVHYPHVRQMINNIERRITQAANTVKAPPTATVADNAEEFRPPLLLETTAAETISDEPAPIWSGKPWMSPVVAPLLSL